jgi:preprotein translocase subunit SecD
LRERNTALLVGIAILAIVLIWIDLPDNPGIHIHWNFINIDKDIQVHQGLDLQGGLQVLLEADVPEGTEIDPEAIDTAKVIVENRVNGLGVTEPLVQKRGERRISRRIIWLEVKRRLRKKRRPERRHPKQNQPRLPSLHLLSIIQ